jgi:hypothetical protein
VLLDESDQARAVILDEVQSTRQWLLNELAAAADDRGVSIVDVDHVALQRVFVRRVPEVCALMSQTLLRVSEGDSELLIEQFAEHPWFSLPALARATKELEDHWIRCVPYLHNWRGWEPVLVDIDPDVDLEIQGFRNAISGKVVVDFVGLVELADAESTEHDPMQAAYLGDAQRIFEALEWELDGEFLALRCLTPHPDGVEVRWLPSFHTDDDELDALDAMNP